MINIYNEDCLDVLKRLPDNSVDLFLQDTPYNTTQNKWDVKLDLPVLWKEWIRVGKENTPFIFTAAQPFTTDLICSNRKMFKYDLIWYKALGSGFLNANKMPMRNHEHILIFYKKQPTYNPQKYIGKMKDKGRKKGGTSTNYGDYNPTSSKNNEYFPQSVLDFTNGDRTSQNDHPTQKDLDLWRYLIKTYSNENDVVFDGYSGSGTTAIACLEEKRQCISAENDTENGYYAKSIERLRIAQLQTKLF